MRTRVVEQQNRTQGETAALLRILQLDADVRRIKTERELIYYLANETRSVLGYRQAFVLRRRHNWALEAVSSVTSFDKNAPINREIRKFVAGLSGRVDDTDVIRVGLNEEAHLTALQDHMFQHAIWIPLKTRKGRVFAGLLILHEREWPESVLPLVERVAEAGAHAWQALKGQSLDRRRWLPRTIVLPVILGGLIALGFVQAPLTVLAPAEVTGEDSVAVRVPLEGVIESILVRPNHVVSVGSVLARIEDTELRNALSIAERKVIVSQARLAQLQNASFTDREAAREVKVAEAELALANSERALAQDRLGRIEIKANGNGIAVFDDPNELTGRPVSVGEKIMEIVSPDNLEFTVRLPVIDNIDLQQGSKVRIFLDGNPLDPIDATLTRTSYRAITQTDGSFAYTLKAQADSEVDLDTVRIGAHGTAQLYGDRHSLYFIVFRRPLSWLRQAFGV
ncbi:MAG: hypothetical protein CMI67_20830 [Pelagibaca sp.]|nr:hypothetical protein [Pelagibaca sp.]